MSGSDKNLTVLIIPGAVYPPADVLNDLAQLSNDRLASIIAPLAVKWIDWSTERTKSSLDQFCAANDWILRLLKNGKFNRHSPEHTAFWIGQMFHEGGLHEHLAVLFAERLGFFTERRISIHGEIISQSIWLTNCACSSEMNRDKHARWYMLISACVESGISINFRGASVQQQELQKHYRNLEQCRQVAHCEAKARWLLRPGLKRPPAPASV